MYVYNYLTKSIPDTTLSPLPLHPRAKEQLKLLHKGSFKIQTVQAVPCNLLRIFSTIESSQLVIYILPFSWLRFLPLHPCCRHYTTHPTMPLYRTTTYTTHPLFFYVYIYGVVECILLLHYYDRVPFINVILNVLLSAARSLPSLSRKLSSSRHIMLYFTQLLSISMQFCCLWCDAL